MFKNNDWKQELTENVFLKEDVEVYHWVMVMADLFGKSLPLPCDAQALENFVLSRVFPTSSVLHYLRNAGPDIEIERVAEHDFSISRFGYARRYAVYGVAPPLDLIEAKSAARDHTADDIDEALQAFIAGLRRFVDAIPVGWKHAKTIVRTVTAAEARFLIDKGDRVSFEQLVALASSGEWEAGDVPTEFKGLSDLDRDAFGRISASDALGWLTLRPDFRTTIEDYATDQT